MLLSPGSPWPLGSLRAQCALCPLSPLFFVPLFVLSPSPSLPTSLFWEPACLVWRDGESREMMPLSKELSRWTHEVDICDRTSD